MNGQVLFNSPTEAPIPPFSFTGQIQTETTVLDAASDGTYTLLTRVLAGQMAVRGPQGLQQQNIPETPPQVSRINALGRAILPHESVEQLEQVKSMLGFDPSKVFNELTAFQTIPTQAMAVGSRWQRKTGIAIPPQFSFSLVADNRLNRFVSLYGVPTAEVLGTVKLPVKFVMDQQGTGLRVVGNGLGKLRENYSLATGMPVRINGNLSMGVELAVTGEQFRGFPGHMQSGRLQFDGSMALMMVRAKRDVDTSTLAALARQSQTAGWAARLPSFRPPFGGPATLPRRPQVSGPSPQPNAAAPAVAPPPAPPVTLWVPTNKGVIPRGTVTVQALPPSFGGESGKGMRFVAFTVNGKRAFVTNSVPYRFTWDTSELPAGTYRLGVELFDANGQPFYSTPTRTVKLKS